MAGDAVRRVSPLQWPRTAISASAAASPVLSVLLPVVGLIVLMGVVFACVHHADVIAHRTGEPYGTLVLTIAVTVIEVALILSIMLAGEGKPDAGARDGVLGDHGRLQRRGRALPHPGRPALRRAGLPGPGHQRLSGRADAARDPDADPADLHHQRPGPVLHAEPAGVRRSRHPRCSMACSFTSRRCATATTSCRTLVSGGDDARARRRRGRSGRAWCMLLVGLVAVVLLAKSVAGSIETVVSAIGAPTEAVGLLVALLVLLPETVAALGAARRNELQKSLNLALGSSLATIGLTIPAVSMLALMLKVAAGARRRHARYRPAGADLRASASSRSAAGAPTSCRASCISCCSRSSSSSSSFREPVLRACRPPPIAQERSIGQGGSVPCPTHP